MLAPVERDGWIEKLIKSSDSLALSVIASNTTETRFSNNTKRNPEDIPL
jgi:hypothetical protein